jgi:hypothetical protein
LEINRRVQVLKYFPRTVALIMMEINNSAPMPNIEQEGCLAYVHMEQEGTDTICMMV